MKNLKTYIPSLLMSILLVFSLLGVTALVVAETYASPEKLFSLAEENDVIPKVQKELEKYFGDKYNETGVPAEIYTGAIDNSYIQDVINMFIDESFTILEEESSEGFVIPVNAQLEKSITDFFSGYADSNGYEKDENYNKKLENTIASAYNAVGDYCDIYKLEMMQSEGILSKAGVLYRNLDTLLIAAVGVTAVLAVILLLVNLKQINIFLYWLGVSGFISGVIGLVPCIYLNATSYFDSFVIKQPHIFTSYTKLLYGVVNTFMTGQLIVIAAGVLLLGVYLLSHRFGNTKSK